MRRALLLLAAAGLLAVPAAVAEGVHTSVVDVDVEPHVDPGAGLLLPVAYADYRVGSDVLPASAAGVAGCYRFFCFGTLRGAAAGHEAEAVGVCIAGVAICGANVQAEGARVTALCYNLGSPPLANGCFVFTDATGDRAGVVCFQGLPSAAGCAAELEGSPRTVVLLYVVPPLVCAYVGSTGACNPL